MDDVKDVTTPACDVDIDERQVTDRAPRPGTTDRLRSAWAGARAALGSLLGLLPHVMHHVGIVAGTALLAGTWGNLALYLLGLLLSIPMFRRLRRRFGSPVAPVVGAAVFTSLFLFSALVLGPAITKTSADPLSPAPTASSVADEHVDHHP